MRITKILVTFFFLLPVLGFSADDMRLSFEDQVQKIDDRGDTFWVLFRTRSAVYRLSKNSRDTGLLTALRAALASKKPVSVEADMDTMELSLPVKK